MKIIKIKNCNACPFLEETNTHAKPICRRNREKGTVDRNTISVWCDLESAPYSIEQSNPADQDIACPECGYKQDKVLYCQKCGHKWPLRW